MNRGCAQTGRSYSSPRGRSSHSFGRYPHRGGHSYSNPGRKMVWKPKNETSNVEGFQHNQNDPNFSDGGLKQLDSSAALDSASSFTCHRSNERQLDETEVHVEKTLKVEAVHTGGFQHNQSTLNVSGGEPKQIDSSAVYHHQPKGKKLDEKEVHIEKGVVEESVDGSPLHLDLSLKENISSLQFESQQSVQLGAIKQPSQEQYLKSVGNPGDSGNSDKLQAIEPFHICPPKAGGVQLLKPSLLTTNRQKRNDAKRALEQQGEILQEGMVLLKGYLSMEDQVAIVKQCQLLGEGLGGFYQPGYRDGAKLHLKMMCLGKNWDPNTSQYGDHRPDDGAKPPFIPVDFLQLVERALKSSRALVEKSSETSNAENIIPWMSPDICIVNFYSTSGRLGLHQDKDESEVSLKKGLPVVSFSIGDTGEFLYGNSRNEDNTKKVMLESGDVLIFGGKARHIFHGVRSVNPKTAPKSLIHETNLRPGRLNLTFRQY